MPSLYAVLSILHCYSPIFSLLPPRLSLSSPPHAPLYKSNWRVCETVSNGNSLEMTTQLLSRASTHNYGLVSLSLLYDLGMLVRN